MFPWQRLYLQANTDEIGSS